MNRRLPVHHWCTGRLAAGFAAALLVVSLVGCLSARRGEPFAPPVDRSDPVVARGEKIFYAHCHGCHPHGQGGLGPALNNKPLPGFLMKFQVRHGLGAMPSIDAAKLPSEDLDALIAYLKALRAQRRETS